MCCAHARTSDVETTHKHTTVLTVSVLLFFKMGKEVQTYFRDSYVKFLDRIIGRILSDNLSESQIADEVAKGFYPYDEKSQGLMHAGASLDDVVRNARNLNACLNDERNHATHTYFHRVLLCIVCHPCSR